MHTIIKTKMPTIGITAILFAFGFALVFESGRWSKTPAYGNLLHIFAADTWGYIYLGVAVVMAAGMWFTASRFISVLAHTAAFVLLLGWEFAFIIRRLTDGATTSANVIAWLAYLGIILWSAFLIDRRPVA
jgi:hypothetical protein